MKKLYLLLVGSVSLLALAPQANAQALKNDGVITVQSNGTDEGLIYVNGDVEISSTGSMTNNGVVEVKGNWANNRTDGAIQYGGTGSGVVKFSGSGTLQTISTTSSNQEVVFHSLETSNPLSFTANTPTAGVYIDDTLVVNGTLIFNGGGVAAMTKNVVIGLNGSCSGYTSVYNARFTSGSFIKKVSSSQLGSQFTLPYYKQDGTTTWGDNYLPVSLTLNAAPSQADQVKVKFIPNTNIGNIFRVWGCTTLNGTALGNQNIMMSHMLEQFGFWQIDAEDASGNNLDNTAGWTYDITLYPPDGAVDYLNTTYGADYFKILRIPSHSGNTLLGFNPSTADWSGNVPESGNICSGIAPIAVYSAANGVQAEDVHKFSRFAGGGNGGGASLPIELLSIEANPVDNQYIEVKWSTAVEINNDGFEVLRSTDGTNFNYIGWVDGNGSTTEQKDYAFEDHNVQPNTIYYYRLNQVDYNGDAELSQIVSASINMSNVFVVGDFVPNPTSNSTTIDVTASDVRNINVTVFNTLGQLMFSNDYDIVPGSNRLNFDFSNFADGTYYTVITADGEVYNKKLVLTK